MSSISRNRSGFQRFEDNNTFDSIDEGIPAPFPIQDLYPINLAPTSTPLVNRTVIVQPPSTPAPVPLYRIYSPGPIAPIAIPPSFEEKPQPHAQTVGSMIDPAAIAAQLKLERDRQHEAFMVRVLHCIDTNASIDFANGMVFDLDIPTPPENLLHLGLATMRPDVINLLCRLHSPLIEKLGDYICKRIFFDVSKNYDKKLDKYPSFLLEICKQNPDKISPDFLLKAYLRCKGTSFKNAPYRGANYHVHIISHLIQTYGLTPEKILSNLDKKQLYTINPVLATIMGIKTQDIIAAQRKAAIADVNKR